MIILIEENSQSNASVCYLRTKLSSHKTFSFLEEIINVLVLIEFMDFMINVKTYLNKLLGKRKYNLKLWKLFSDVFNVMPVSALLDEKILCMHGGLSPQL